MSTIANHKTSTARLDFRISPELKAVVMRAAASLGQSLTDYSVSRLIEIARQDIRKQETTTLSDRDRDLFLTMLDSDGEPNKAMKRAAARYKKIRA